MIPRSKKDVFTENDLMIYLAICMKHLRLMVLLFCFAIVLGLTYYAYSRPVYSSTAEISYEVLSRASSMGRSVDAQMAFKDSTDRLIRAQLLSSHLQELTAKRLGINASSKTIKGQYVPRVIIRMNPQKNMVIETYAYTYELARDWPQALLQEYLLDREKNRLATVQLTFETFSKDMAELQERIDANFNSKHAFRTSNDLTKVTIELNNLKVIPQDLLLVKKKLGVMDRTLEILKGQELDTIGKLSLLNPMEDDKLSISVGELVPKETEGSDAKTAIVVVPTMVNSSSKRTWVELDYERRQFEQQHAELGRTFGSKHPKMLEIKKKMTEVQRALDVELEVAMKRFELNYANLQSKQRELENTLPAYNEAMRRYDKALEDYKSFDDGQLAWRRMYADMEKRLNLLDFAEDKERVSMKFLGYLEPLTNYPVAPNVMKLALYSIVLGLGLAIAVPFLIEYLDSRISDMEDAEESLRLRGLGVVPKIDAFAHEAQLLLDGEQQDHHFQENFRVIRTNLALGSQTGELPQVILITSAMPQEGKTVVSSNLAVSFASKGERTLLIDADLRRGRLARLFQCDNKPGLTEILRDKRSIEEGSRPTRHANLTIMPSGKHINTASELLDSQTFTDLVNELRQRYDRIIIDTPPVLGLADSTIVQRSVDGILFVIWNEFTPVRNVKTAIQILQGTGGKLMGFVLNRLDFHALGNRYKYFYYTPSYYSNYKALPAAAPEN